MSLVRYVFLRLPRVQAALSDLENCPCGTQSACEACVGPSEYLNDLWIAWCNRPIRFLLGSYGDCQYQRNYPLELWQRLMHKLFGYWRGCSCTTCFNRRRRYV